MTITIATLRALRAKPARERSKIIVVLAALACLTGSLGDFRRLVMTVAPGRLPAFDDAVMQFIMTEAARDPADERWIDAAAFAEREFATAHAEAIINEQQRQDVDRSEFAKEVRRMRTTIRPPETINEHKPLRRNPILRQVSAHGVRP